MLPVLVASMTLFTFPQPQPPEKREPTPAASPAHDPAPPPPRPPLVFPHPMITEVLYAVPTGEDGDASRDGSRHVAGDEFIELINPHDRPIQLLGYTVTDRNPPGKGQFRFTFPALELPPSGIVVVFNGCEQTWDGAAVSEAGGATTVGDARRAPDKPNPKFHGAYVFTARAPSQRTSWANGGDFALLSDPAGRPIHCVTWGTFKEPTPAALLVEQAPATSRCSVQRRAVNDVFVEHTLFPAEPPAASSPATPPLFSPGLFKPVPPRAEEPAPAAPAGKPSERAPAPEKPLPLEIKPPPPKHK